MDKNVSGSNPVIETEYTNKTLHLGLEQSTPIGFGSKLQSISSGEGRSVQRLKYRVYDEDSGPM